MRLSDILYFLRLEVSGHQLVAGQEGCPAPRPWPLRLGGCAAMPLAAAALQAHAHPGGRYVIYLSISITCHITIHA